MHIARQDLSQDALLSLKSPAALIRAAALVALVGAFALPNMAHAADASDPADSMSDQSTTTTQTTTTTHESHGHHAKEMAAHVEQRIKTLHDKLRITSDQEQKWTAVAQSMRDNEAEISQLIEERHQNHASMTAVDDLQSYENITQAHVDGLKKLIPAFQSLYSDMSDDQKKNADKVFGEFKGHDGKMSKKHM